MAGSPTQKLLVDRRFFVLRVCTCHGYQSGRTAPGHRGLASSAPGSVVDRALPAEINRFVGWLYRELLAMPAFHSLQLRRRLRQWQNQLRRQCRSSSHGRLWLAATSTCRLTGRAEEWSGRTSEVQDNWSGLTLPRQQKLVAIEAWCPKQRARA